MEWECCIDRAKQNLKKFYFRYLPCLPINTFLSPKPKPEHLGLKVEGSVYPMLSQLYFEVVKRGYLLNPYLADETEVVTLS